MACLNQAGADRCGAELSTAAGITGGKSLWTVGRSEGTACAITGTMDDAQSTDPLPPAYYLDHFMQVVEGVRARYGFLLTAAERRHLAAVEMLSLPARMLYARLVNRRGPCFRLDRLPYPEIGALDKPVSELLRAGLIEACRAPEAHSWAPLLACFTHAELKAGLRGAPAPRHARKEELLAWLGGWEGRGAWLDAFLATQPMVAIPQADPWPFLRFLFFGGMRDNLSDFVVRDLGLVVTESVDAARLSARYTTRGEAEDAFRMAVLYAAFRRVRAMETALQTLGWWRAQGVERASLCAGTLWLDRLVDRLGRLLEREGETGAALALYAESPVAPARERRARLLIKAGRPDEARALLRAILAAPCHAEEAYAARQMLARLERTARRSEARHYQHASAVILLDYPEGGVEAAVLAHYRSAGWQGVHSENWLWNAGFGLLLWDIIYDPAVGVFHSPVQMAPSDLHDPAFYSRRQAAIEARLALLDDKAAAFAVIERLFEAKKGIANPFVSWHEDLPRLLGIMLKRLPPAGLAASFRHLAQDVARHSRGLPDLFLWTDEEYRFIEVKAENDHLSAHQYEWLSFMDKAGLRVSLERIRRPAAP